MNKKQILTEGIGVLIFIMLLVLLIFSIVIMFTPIILAICLNSVLWIVAFVISIPIGVAILFLLYILYALIRD